ncbi:MAG: NAD(P)-dependent glycerol-3-phosphate dehydrogenase [Deltaproteobacteria bacterium]|nr:NAD(P)-dependent glycerol-3-phosphate dehydrogenase [Deltaproteobacteria bacterium]
MSESVAIIGAGSFGTALAKVFAENGHRTVIWARDAETARQINDKHRHPRYLTSVQLPAGLVATAAFEDALRDAQVVVCSVPSHAVRTTFTDARPFLRDDQFILSATKGIENETLMTVAQVLEQVLPASMHPRLAYLSGPSFALELARRVPTAVTIASRNADTAERMQRIISCDYFRAYTTDDVVGVELAGALKNVVAIGVGCAEGLGFGYNARAAMITRGLAEMARLGMKMGANPMTFAGLAGVGDLMLTCFGELSRNRSVGFQLGQGKKLEDILKNLGMVAEGVKTAKSAWDLSQREGVEMPLAHAAYQILYEGRTPRDIVYELMGRALRKELDH